MDKNNMMAQFASVFNFGNDRKSPGGHVPLIWRDGSTGHFPEEESIGTQVVNKAKSLVTNFPQNYQRMNQALIDSMSSDDSMENIPESVQTTVELATTGPEDIIAPALLGISDKLNIPRNVSTLPALLIGSLAGPPSGKLLKKLKPRPIRTAELGKFPTKRSEAGALIKQQQDALKSPEDLKLERKDFTQTYNIATQGPLKHHHKGDQYFAGKVANRTDSSTVFKMLEEQEGIVLGDKAQNIIGLADQKTYLRRTSAMEDVAKQLGWEGLPPNRTPERRLLDDLFKEPKKNQRVPTPGDPQSWGLPRGKELGSGRWAIGLDPSIPKKEQMNIIENAYKNRFAYNNIDKSKIKYDRGGTIVSGDHIDLTHYTGIDSKDFKQRTELINLFESGEHLNLSSLQLKNKITEVYRIQENIAVNVAVRRMNFIRKHLNQLAKDGSRQAKMALSSPEATRKWIVNNPSIAGNIGWKLKKPGFKELSQTPNSRYLKEWRDGQSPLQIIFGKGASISRPKGWEAPATSNQLKQFAKHFNHGRD